jgi:hypothetical protein
MKKMKNRKGLTMIEYEAKIIINIFDTDIEITLSYLEEELSYSDLRDVLLEYAYDSLYIKSYSYTSHKLED